MEIMQSPTPLKAQGRPKKPGPLQEQTPQSEQSTTTYQFNTEEARRQAILQDPVTFCREILNETPHKAQEKFLRGVIKKKYCVAACGRKWGKSLALAWYIAWWMATHPGRSVFIVAPTLQQSRIIFDKVVYYFTKIAMLKKMLAKKPVNSPFPKLTLLNDTVLQARGTANDVYLRGEEADLVVADEAAYIRDVTISDVIEPMFTVSIDREDSQFILISTPAGKNIFYDWFQRGQSSRKEDRDFVSFQFPTSSNPYHSKTFLEAQKRACGEESMKWRAEYLAEFIDGSLAIFAWSDVERAYLKWPDNSRPPFHIQPLPDHRYVMGVDVADAGKDFTVISVFDYTDPKAITLVRMERHNRVGWAKVYRSVRENYERYNHPIVHCDTTGMGSALLEELKDISATGYKIATNEAKQELVNRAVRAFSGGLVVIPPDRDITSEFRYFQATVTKAGNVKMEAARGHDDIVLSICLALYPIMARTSTGFFKSVKLSPCKESMFAEEEDNEEEHSEKAKRFRERRQRRILADRAGLF